MLRLVRAIPYSGAIVILTPSYFVTRCANNCTVVDMQTGDQYYVDCVIRYPVPMDDVFYIGSHVHYLRYNENTQMVGLDGSAAHTESVDVSAYGEGGSSGRLCVIGQRRDDIYALFCSYLLCFSVSIN